MILSRLVLSLSVAAVCLSGCSSSFGSASERALRENNGELVVLFTHVNLGTSLVSNILLLDSAIRIEEEMSQSLGVINHAIRKDFFSNDIWSRGLWSDVRSASRFIDSGFHWQSMCRAAGPKCAIDYALVKLRKGDSMPSWTAAERCFVAQRRERPSNSARVDPFWCS
jgi:hypothetical protein